MHELIRTLAGEYTGISSLSELYQTTAALVKDTMDADFGVVVTAQDGSVQAVATMPDEWTDADDLLSPTSLPNIAASQGQSYIIDDKSNVRSAAKPGACTNGGDVAYPSILWVPFGDGGFLLAGARRKAAFIEPDLGRLRVISAITDVLRQRIEASTDSAIESDAVAEAARFLSHDTRNLLDVIQGRLELARETPEAEQFTAIQRNVDRLEELIEDTVLLLQTGDHLTDRQPVSLKTMAQNAWANIGVNEANLYIHTDETILADESRLCQLFENLFRNAVEHAAPDVDIWLGTLDDGEGFYVMDDGPGIDPADAEALFDLGYTTSQGNTGLGLSIVKRIADAHGWDVTATNGESGGARFEFHSVESVTE